MSADLKSFIIKGKKGDVLFAEGDPGDEMFFIHSGRVRIEKKLDTGMECLAVMEKGDFFGEMSVLERTSRTASAVVEEDGEFLRVNQANFEKLLAGNIEIAVRMIRKYASRLREANARLHEARKDQKEIDDGMMEILHSVKNRPDSSAGHEPYARFAMEDGSVTFDVAAEEVLIGRLDPVTHIVPDIDLTALDKGRSVSRRHAKLRVTNGQFLLYEEVGVSNGTQVNGQRLIPGQPVTLMHGAKVLFGNVPLEFRTRSDG